MNQRSINDAGLALIKSFESCSLKPYFDSTGVATVGFGHTDGVSINDPECTQDQADSWLIDDLMNAEDDVARLIHSELTDNQFSALVSLVFNCGTKPLLGHIGQYLNEESYEQAADAFLWWDHGNGGKVIPGLTRRRIAERELFLTK